MTEYSLRAENNRSCGSIDFYLQRYTRSMEGPHLEIAEVVFKECNANESLAPSFRFSRRTDEAAAQTLMDDLWACGIRPTEGSGSAGSLAATERHLKDMQELVFKHFAPKLQVLKEPLKGWQE